MCEFKENKDVKVSELAEQQVEEESSKEECQVETLPQEITFEDMCINQ